MPAGPVHPPPGSINQPGGGAGGAYSIPQIELLWIQYGGSAATAPLAAAIAMAESGGKPTAINHNTNGSVDRGLFQINSVHGAQSSTDLATNIKAAIAISSNGTNWNPWTTYTSGKYKPYLTQAQDAIKTLDTGSSTLDQVLNAPSAAVSAIGDVGSSVGSIATLLTSGQFWLRLGEAIAGVILLVMGLRSLSGTTTSPMSVARSVARKVPVPV